MATLRKRLTPEGVVQGYFYIKEDIKAISRYAESTNKTVHEAAIKGLAEIKASIPNFEQQIDKVREKLHDEMYAHEGDFMGRISDAQLQEDMDEYEQDIIMLDLLEDDAKGLYELVGDCERRLAGEKVEERPVDENEPKNVAEYIEYTKEAIEIAKRKKSRSYETSMERPRDVIADVGMVSSAVVAASNPVLGSALMVANLIGKQHRQNQADENNQASAPQEMGDDE